jgi:hypothetical protein
MCSSNGAKYVAQQIRIESWKVKTCSFGLAKWFWPSIFPQYSELGKGTTDPNKCHLTAMFIVINMIRLELPVSDWPTIMMRPGGLHSLVLTYLHFWVYGWGSQINIQLNLDVRNIFAGSHTEHGAHSWSSSDEALSLSLGVYKVGIF